MADVPTPWLQIVLGGVYIVGALVFGLIDLFNTGAGAGTFCTAHFPASVLSYSVGLSIGVLFMGLVYVLTGVWGQSDTDAQINARYRPWRWIAHGVLLTFVFKILLNVAGFNDLYVLWMASIFVAVGLSYKQSSTESMNAGNVTSEAYKNLVNTSKTRTWFSDMSAFEGWVFATVIFAVLAIVSLLRAFNFPTSLLAKIFVIVVLAWYFILHVIVFIDTVLTDHSVSGNGLEVYTREAIFLIWEFILIAFAFIYIYAAFPGVPC